MITLKNNKLMLYFDVLKDDIMDNIFEKCYEPLYLEILELETKIELLKLKINENYDLNDYLYLIYSLILLHFYLKDFYKCNHHILIY